MTRTEHWLKLSKFFRNADDFLTGEDLKGMEHYASDSSPQLHGQMGALCFPRNAETVAAVLKYCSEKKIGIVPSGGRTGYAGGATAAAGDLVISLDKMNMLVEFDPEAATIEVEAGMITDNVSEYSREKNLFYPVKFSSSGSSQIGGNIGTNAGGLKVVRYGMTRRQVAGMTFVTGDGRIITTGSKVVKDNSGYNLSQLLCGSEGTLGIICSALLRLQPLPGEKAALLGAAENINRVIDAFRECRRRGLLLNSFEIFDAVCLETVLSVTGLHRPLGASPWYFLAEAEISREEDADMMAEIFSASPETVLATDEKRISGLWQYRERISESLGRAWHVHKYDVSIPLSEMQTFAEKFTGAVKKRHPGADAATFGHIGDSNIHFNLLWPREGSAGDENFFRTEVAPWANDLMFTMIRDCRGSISAEHGIGLLKKKGLTQVRPLEEIQLMKEIKKAFDPAGILNRGKIFD